MRGHTCGPLHVGLSWLFSCSHILCALCFLAEGVISPRCSLGPQLKGEFFSGSSLRSLGIRQDHYRPISLILLGIYCELSGHHAIFALGISSFISHLNSSPCTCEDRHMVRDSHGRSCPSPKYIQSQAWQRRWCTKCSVWASQLRFLASSRLQVWPLSPDV